MLFLIIVIALYSVLENVFKISKDDNIQKKIIKLISIVGFSLAIINLIYEQSLLNVLFVLIIIYIVSNTKKDSLYELMTNINNVETFKDEYELDSEYYKYYRNNENSFSRVFNDDYEEEHYKLNNLYPTEKKKDNKDKKEKSNDHRVVVTDGYDEELNKIKEGLMDKFWLIDDKKNYKKKPKCTTTTNKPKVKTTSKPVVPKSNLCYFFDKIISLFI
jgi:hypothetical protein